MKSKSILFGLLALLAIACSTNTNPGANPSKKLIVASESAVERFQCPMKCEGDTAYTTAGICPVCEMDLEKVK